MAQIIKIFVAAPKDVAAEKAIVREVANSLNQVAGKERGVRFDPEFWDTDTRRRVSDDGPQQVIYEDLPMEQNDIVIGILWTRLGTPDPMLNGQTGTEHELRTAVECRRRTKKPEVVLCFKEAQYFPKNSEESKEITRVFEFREQMSRLNLELTFNNENDFREKIRYNLHRYLADHYPLTPGTVTTPQTADPTPYITALREETSHFDVQGLKFGDNRAYRFPIDEFYIPLTTTTSSGAPAEAESRTELRPQPIPLQEAVSRHRKLLVVGDPGSGKSTFLRRIAFQACNEYAAGGPLPLRIEAAILSTFITNWQAAKKGPPDPASPEWIPLFAGAQCEEKNRHLAADYFKTALQKGACLVLVDGLDETPDELTRERMARLLWEAAAAFNKSRFVVTSRPEGKVPIPDFEEARIADLEPEAIRAFLAKLSHQLYPNDEARERQFRQDLEAAVNGRREIRKMTRNPVMLTALAVLQHNHIKLPEKRVDLYQSILDWLSKQRAKPGRMSAADCLLRLRELALEMQNHEEGRQKQVTFDWAAEKLAKRFGNRELAKRFLRAEQTDSGIVVSRKNGDLAYWHLTFQEYLAALEIAGWEDAEQFNLLLGGNLKIYHPEWRESVLLYGGLLHNAGPRKVDALLRNLLDSLGGSPSLAQRAKCVGLIGSLLPDLTGYQVTDARYAQSLQLVLDIFDAQKSKAVPFADRLAAAEALGQAGDSRLAQHQWVTIPETRNYWIGAQKKDRKQRNYDEEDYGDETLRQINLPTFQIAKYPVTVSQYASFVEDGATPGREPNRWVEQQEHPSWPVVNVTWHQATAYAEWAQARLPTEEEWERAARGPNGTKYPWGNQDIDPSRANYKDSKIGHPTPVGLYPLGVSPEGVCDLIGNVFEWTSSKWRPGSESYVWRGGSFYILRRFARSSYRDCNLPVGQVNYLGFRLARGIT